MPSPPAQPSFLASESGGSKSSLLLSSALSLLFLEGCLWAPVPLAHPFLYVLLHPTLTLSLTLTPFLLASLSWMVLLCLTRSQPTWLIKVLVNRGQQRDRLELHDSEPISAAVFLATLFSVVASSLSTLGCYFLLLPELSKVTSLQSRSLPPPPVCVSCNQIP